jgi:hypothetical protein
MEKQKKLVSVIKPKTFLLARSARITLLLAYFYVFFEWLYSLSKSSSSYMYQLSWPQRIGIVFIAGVALTLLALVVLFIFTLIRWLASLIFPKLNCDFLLFIPPALLIACVSLIAVDNFTYTVFKIGIITISSYTRLIYSVGFLAIFILATFLLSRAKAKPSQLMNKINQSSVGILLGISVVFLVIAIFTNNVDLENVTQKYQKLTNTPNIIFLSTDGLNASEMSAYGYSRETTPFIKELTSTSLISENNFTNIGHTTGSITSVLTGKLAFDTNVLFPPDILRGSDTFEHLPAILKSAGYTTTQVGVPYYVDADAENFQNAFDSINCSDSSQLRYLVNRLTAYKFDDANYLLATIHERIRDRLLHIFFIKNITNPSAIVNQMSKYASTDADRMNCLIGKLKDAKTSGQPIFAQIHLMITHGQFFYPVSNTFSKGEKQYGAWIDDFYDDATLDFDNDVKMLVEYLKSSQEYDNTIIVLYSDHGQQWVTDKKTPMIIHFPSDQYAGKITTNTQNIDVAPTILDYLGISKPAWMDGDSILNDLPKNRVIITANSNRMAGSETGLVAIPEKNISAPFYQFSELVAMQCQKAYSFDFDKFTITTSNIQNYISPCSQDELDSVDSIASYVTNSLTSFGYKVTNNWTYK